MTKKENKVVEGRKLRRFGMSTDGKIHIEWLFHNDLANCDDERTLSSVEEPVNILKDAWIALAPIACEMAELPENWKLIQRGLTVSYKKDKRMFTLNVIRLLEKDDKVLNITTPCKLQSEVEEFGCMKKAHIEVIDTFIEQVWKYLDGHRVQPELPGIKEE